jgi:putative FmdB family regulatory protein
LTTETDGRRLPRESNTSPDVERRAAMPLYEYYCEKCHKEFSTTMSMSEHEKTKAACPGCGSRDVRPLMGTIFTQTSKKS